MLLPEPDPALCRALAHDLDRVGYTAERLRALWGDAADGALGRGHAIPARRALAASVEDVAVVALLFGLGDPVGLADADRVLPTVGSAGLEALGLARRDGGMLVPLALVRPQSFVDEDGAGQWWIASDLDEAALRGPLAEDHVLGAGGASLTLAGLQLPTPATRVLDLGCGCGIQSLRARRFAPEVVATDLSERAVRFTRLNAALNDMEGIHTLVGDLFAPVEGELFERIVSNPPFVITPRVGDVPAYEYRDAGRVGDALVEDVVRGVGAHLEPGGIAQLLGNWEYRAGLSGLDRVRSWIEESAPALDAWVIERERMDPVAYAELWIRDGGTVPGTSAYDDLLSAWLADFEARGVEHIGFGYLLLRRPVSGAPTLARFERVEQTVPEGAGRGAALARSLQAHDRLTRLGDDEFARERLVIAGDVTEARHHLPGEDAPRVIELRQGAGFARTVAVDPALAGVVGACDGELSAGRLIDAVADLLEVDPGALRAELLPRLRELVVDGFLAFADA